MQFDSGPTWQEKEKKPRVITADPDPISEEQARLEREIM